MYALETIDILALDSVTGGNDAAPNTSSTSGNIGVTVPTRRGQSVQVGVQGNHSTARTNYAECIGAVRAAGGTPAEMRQTCGLPGGGE